MHSEALGFDRAWYAARGLGGSSAALELATWTAVPLGQHAPRPTRASPASARSGRAAGPTSRWPTAPPVGWLHTDWVITDERGAPTRVPDEFPAAFAAPPGPFEPVRVAAPADARRCASAIDRWCGPTSSTRWTTSTTASTSTGSRTRSPRRPAVSEALDRVPRRVRIEYLAPAGLGDELESVAWQHDGGWACVLAGPAPERTRSAASSSGLTEAARRAGAPRAAAANPTARTRQRTPPTADQDHRGGRSWDVSCAHRRVHATPRAWPVTFSLWPRGRAWSRLVDRSGWSGSPGRHGGRPDPAPATKRIRLSADARPAALPPDARSRSCCCSAACSGPARSCLSAFAASAAPGRSGRSTSRGSPVGWASPLPPRRSRASSRSPARQRLWTGVLRCCRTPTTAARSTRCSPRCAGRPRSRRTSSMCGSPRGPASGRLSSAGDGPVWVRRIDPRRSDDNARDGDAIGSWQVPRDPISRVPDAGVRSTRV